MHAEELPGGRCNIYNFQILTTGEPRRRVFGYKLFFQLFYRFGI